MAWIIDKEPAVFLKHSPSLGLNNLTANASSFAYVHKGSVVICSLDGNLIQTLANDEAARAFQVLQCSNEAFDFLVVALDSGVQVWSTDGQRMIYFFDVKGGRPSSSTEDIGQLAQVETQGIAMVPKGRLFIVGCSDGDVFAFEAKCGPKGETCELHATLKGHQHPVTCAAADTDWLASGDASGGIIAWSAEGNLARECSFDGDGNPATSLCARGDQVIAAFSTGHVRIFHIGNKALAIEIAAHSRAINAIDLHPTSMLLATVGEDLYLNVWELPEGRGQEEPSSGQVGLLASSRVSNCLMTGVRFLADGSHRIAGTAYDCDVVHMWHRI